MSKNVLVSISLLSANFSNLEKEIKKCEDAGVDYLHFDVMDGHFVDNISFGIPVLKSIAKIHNLVNDVHIMIDNPLHFAPRFLSSGADILTFHYEAINKKEDIIKLINLIKSENKKVGISIKPMTNVELIFPYLKMIDLVLVMSVEPGFGGQTYIESSTLKIKKIKDYIATNKLSTLIEVDGGINEESAKKAKEAGADILVAGSYLFGHDDMPIRIKKLKK